MGSLDEFATAELARLRSLDLERRLRPVESAQGTRVVLDGRTYINFSSNDYLGLAADPRLAEAFRRGVGTWGSGSGASRLICGSLRPLHDLEERLSAMWQGEAALLFGSGYACGLGVLSALCDRDAVVVLDKLCHASLIDGSRLSGARLRVFGHNDLDKLESILRSIRRRLPPDTRILVVTESIFSMDGDTASLDAIVELKERYGASLLVDEAHALGVCGPRGAGWAAERGLGDRIDLRLGTLGKAVGVSGGFVVGSRRIVDLLIHRARSLVYSTAPSPALAVAAETGLEVVLSAEGDRLRRRLRANAAAGAAALDLDRPPGPILPYPVGGESAALECSTRLANAGLLAPAIRYPTVARGSARLRITFSSLHTEVDISKLAILRA